MKTHNYPHIIQNIYAHIKEIGFSRYLERDCPTAVELYCLALWVPWKALWDRREAELSTSGGDSQGRPEKRHQMFPPPKNSLKLNSSQTQTLINNFLKTLYTCRFEILIRSMCQLDASERRKGKGVTVGMLCQLPTSLTEKNKASLLQLSSHVLAFSPEVDLLSFRLEN